MTLESSKISNSEDDDGDLRRTQKEALAEYVECLTARQEEFGFLRKLWNKVKDAAKHETNITGKSEGKPAAPRGGSSDFDEKAHPRGPDGRFAEAPASDGKSGGLLHPEILREEQKQEGLKDEIQRLKTEEWENEKGRWDRAENAKVAKKVAAIKRSELGKAEKELRSAKDAANRPDQSDDEAAKSAQRLVNAHKNMKSIKGRIAKIRPAPYKVPKPRKR